MNEAAYFPLAYERGEEGKDNEAAVIGNKAHVPQSSSRAAGRGRFSQRSSRKGVREPLSNSVAGGEIEMQQLVLNF
jgi:hypothetical protein